MPTLKLNTKEPLHNSISNSTTASSAQPSKPRPKTNSHLAQQNAQQTAQTTPIPETPHPPPGPVPSTLAQDVERALILALSTNANSAEAVRAIADYGKLSEPDKDRVAHAMAGVLMRGLGRGGGGVPAAGGFAAGAGAGAGAGGMPRPPTDSGRRRVGVGGVRRGRGVLVVKEEDEMGFSVRRQVGVEESTGGDGEGGQRRLRKGRKDREGDLVAGKDPGAGAVAGEGLSERAAGEGSGVKSAKRRLRKGRAKKKHAQATDGDPGQGMIESAGNGEMRIREDFAVVWLSLISI